VPCPHFSSESGDCLLMQEPEEQDEDLVEIPNDDPVDREWCLASNRTYRNCPVYRRFLAELLP
jgi:hypothetical protein